MTSESSLGPQRNGDADRAATNGQCLLIQDEIWRFVRDAAQTQTMLRVGRTAKSIHSRFRASGFSLRAITDALVFAAIDAGVVHDMRPRARRQVPTIKLPSFVSAGGRRHTVGIGRSHGTSPDVAVQAAG